jgi:peptide/nickel transport system permease protein
VLRLERRSIPGYLAAAFLLGIVLASILTDVVSPLDPFGFDIYERNQAPALDSSHPLGTNFLGQDVLRLVLAGARTSLSVALLAVALAALTGTVLGILAGYRGGWLDHLIMRTVDLQMALPAIMLALFVLLLVGGGFINLVIVLAIARWPIFARVSRGLTLSLREQQFVEAARSIGCRGRHIMRKHIFRNMTFDLLTLGVLEVARAMLAESGLSFLGVGIQSPDVSWGLMLAQGQPYIRTAWWNVIFPGLAITLTALSINFAAIWLRRVTDPFERARGSE